MARFCAVRYPGWTDQAACRDPGYNPELWFTASEEWAAKLVCQGCPVLAQCGEYTRQVRPAFGVFAGLSARERGHGSVRDAA